MVQFQDGSSSQGRQDGNLLSDLLELGNHFVVPAEPNNSKGVKFYILYCTKKKTMVSKRFTCVWGCSFEPGDYCVRGTYYQKWGRGPQSYVFLCQSQPAYLPFECVKQIKFNMIPKSHQVRGTEVVYTLSMVDMRAIQVAIMQWLQISTTLELMWALREHSQEECSSWREAFECSAIYCSVAVYFCNWQPFHLKIVHRWTQYKLVHVQ